MNYLLDTHTFLWTISNTENLSKKATEIIKNLNVINKKVIKEKIFVNSTIRIVFTQNDLI